MMRVLAFCVVWMAQDIVYAQSRSGRPGRRTQVEYVPPAQTQWWQIALLLLLIAVLVYALHRWREPLKRIVIHNPFWLFMQLCRQHQLEWGNCWLLCRVAWVCKLRNPAQLFVSPERLLPQYLGPAWEAEAGRLDSLRARLFDCEPAGNTEPNPSAA